MTDKVIKRGYVKWTDDDGTFHKELLASHPDLLAKASPAEQLAAEEARRLNAAGEAFYEDVEDDANKEVQETLAELKKAPDDVLTAAQLTDETPAAAPEDDGQVSPEVQALKEPADAEHEAVLEKLKEATAE